MLLEVLVQRSQQKLNVSYSPDGRVVEFVNWQYYVAME